MLCANATSDTLTTYDTLKIIHTLQRPQNCQISEIYLARLPIAVILLQQASGVSFGRRVLQAVSVLLISNVRAEAWSLSHLESQDRTLVVGRLYHHEDPHPGWAVLESQALSLHFGSNQSKLCSYPV